MHITISKALSKLSLALTFTSSLTLGACVLNDNFSSFVSENETHLSTLMNVLEGSTTSKTENASRSTTTSVKTNTSSTHSSYTSSSTSSSAKVSLGLDPLSLLNLGGVVNLKDSNNKEDVNARSAQDSTTSLAKEANRERQNRDEPFTYRRQYPEIFRGKSSLPPLQSSHLDKAYNSYPYPGKNPNLENSDMDVYEEDGKNPRAFKYPFTPLINYNQIGGDFVFNPFYMGEDKLSIYGRNLRTRGGQLNPQLEQALFKRLEKNRTNFVSYATDVEQLENLCWLNSYIYKGESENWKLDPATAFKRYLNVRDRYLELYKKPHLLTDLKLTAKILESMMARSLNWDKGQLNLNQYPLAFRTEDFRGMRVLSYEDNYVLLSTPNRYFQLKLSTNGQGMDEVDLTQPLEILFQSTSLKQSDKNNTTCVLNALINQKGR